MVIDKWIVTSIRLHLHIAWFFTFTYYWLLNRNIIQYFFKYSCCEEYEDVVRNVRVKDSFPVSVFSNLATGLGHNTSIFIASSLLRIPVVIWMVQLFLPKSFNVSNLPEGWKILTVSITHSVSPSVPVELVILSVGPNRLPKGYRTEISESFSAHRQKLVWTVFKARVL